MSDVRIWQSSLKKILFNPARISKIICQVTGPWHSGKDLATALGYSNTRDAMRKHVDTEDKTTVAICDTGSNYKSQAVVINKTKWRSSFNYFNKTAIAEIAVF